MSLKAITLRLDESLYEKTKLVAEKEKSSINSFIQNILIEKIKEKEKKELFDEFSLISEDEENDVEYALYAQNEVVFDEKS
jgi:hypothetical protein